MSSNWIVDGIWIVDVINLLKDIKKNQEKEQESLLSIDKKLDTLVELVSTENDMASVLFDELLNASDEEDYDEESDNVADYKESLESFAEALLYSIKDI